MANLTFTIIDDPLNGHEPKLPSYSDVGRVFFELIDVCRSPSERDKYTIEVIDFDGHSSIYWLNEGQGIEYWLQGWLDLDEPGFYVVEGITGQYIRGDGWMTDDDEEWDLEFVRRADDEEIGRGSLRPSDQIVRKFAKRLAERINGGAWKDPQFYTREQRGLWRKHARELLHFLWQTE